MTPEESDELLRYVIAGRLNRDFILPLSGLPQTDVLGGNLPYAAVGLNLWGGTAGLVARVDQDYPIGWFDRFQTLGFDLSGIKIVPESIDSRRFIAHSNAEEAHYQNPIQHYADRGLAVPSELVNYRSDRPNISSRTNPLKYSIQITDIPRNYLDASAVHICPIDYLSHLALPSIFRQGQATTITLEADPGYMSPSFWEEIPGLLSEITAFITSEQAVRSLFQGRLTSLWEMAEVLSGYGPEFILIRTEDQGTHLLDRVNERRWVIPDYPTRQVDPTGAEDAFAGGFLAGYRERYDPMEAAMCGSIAASLVVEGSGVYYALDAMPGLIDKRLMALRELVREV